MGAGAEGRAPVIQDAHGTMTPPSPSHIAPSDPPTSTPSTIRRQHTMRSPDPPVPKVRPPIFHGRHLPPLQGWQSGSCGRGPGRHPDGSCPAGAAGLSGSRWTRHCPAPPPDEESGTARTLWVSAAVMDAIDVHGRAGELSGGPIELAQDIACYQGVILRVSAGFGHRPGVIDALPGSGRGRGAIVPVARATPTVKMGVRPGVIAGVVAGVTLAIVWLCTMRATRRLTLTLRLGRPC